LVEWFTLGILQSYVLEKPTTSNKWTRQVLGCLLDRIIHSTIAPETLVQSKTWDPLNSYFLRIFIPLPRAALRRIVSDRF
jgi:hypothetical protein